MTLNHLGLHRRREAAGARSGRAKPLAAIDVGRPSLVERGAAEVDLNADEEEVATIIETVYQTLTPTFNGPVAGYSTLVQDTRPSSIARKQPQLSPPPTPIASPDVRPGPKPIAAPDARPDVKPAPRPEAKQPQPPPPPPLMAPPSPLSSGYQLGMPSNTQPANIYPLQTLSSSSSTPPARQTGQPTLSGAVDVGRSQPQPSQNAFAAGTSSQSAMGSKNGDEGTSTGAKVGIAFGVMGGLLAVGLLVFFLFNRHRKRAAQRQRLQDDDEKPRVPMKPAPSTNPVVKPTAPSPMDARTRSRAMDATASSCPPHSIGERLSDAEPPRVTLRPVTQLLPQWDSADKGRGAKTHRQQGSGEVTGSPVSSNSSNPFGSKAESFMSASSSDEQQRAESPPSAAAQHTASSSSSSSPGGVARKASMRKDGPNKVDLTLPQLEPIPVSPAGTEFSMSLMDPGAKPPPTKGSAAIAAAGGPRNSGVHRVQLDFNPTLEDEMQLRTGELVRLLHEFDDGWALVIRLDRSQQGVCPRTCLSTRPVKPRPNPGASRVGPPVKTDNNNNNNNNLPKPPPAARPMTPQGGPGLPSSPAPQRKTQSPVLPSAASAPPLASAPAASAPAANAPAANAPVTSETPAKPAAASSAPTTPSTRTDSPLPPLPAEAGPATRPPVQGMTRPSNAPPRGPPAGPPPQPPTGSILPGRKPVPGNQF